MVDEISTNRDHQAESDKSAHLQKELQDKIDRLTQLERSTAQQAQTLEEALAKREEVIKQEFARREEAIKQSFEEREKRVHSELEKYLERIQVRTSYEILRGLAWD